jgi:beta-lactam-binding protein with PASTA domain
MSRYKNLIIALVIFVGFVIVSMVFISWFTKHGERLEVPKVDGLALAGAEELIDENSMEFVVRSSMILSFSISESI